LLQRNYKLHRFHGIINKKDEKKPIALETYEALAERYAELIDTKSENAYYERPATISLLPEVRGKRVLDAGCGAGVYSEWLIEHGAEVVAFDVSPAMVALAKQRLGDGAEIRRADMEKPLDFLGDADFDIILSALALDYIENWTGVLAEFYRVLKNPGTLIFSVGHPAMRFMLDKREDKSYFDTRLEKTEWKGFGAPYVIVPSYSRPLEAMITPLIDAGFRLERICEPRPGEDFKRADPESYERLSRFPGFICFRAAKD